MRSGTATDPQVSGRVFCNFNNGQENMVWTQDAGHLMAYASGPVHKDVWTWWVAVHHNISFANPGALMSAITLANKRGDAKGQLPPSTCTQQGATKVTCVNPVGGINGVVFQTYPSLSTLYDAYMAQVRTLNNGQFNANFADCGLHATFGEVGWNHMFQHPKTFSIQQMSSGMVNDAQAAGRVFCNFNNGQENMVWTQDSGRLLAYVSGPVHEDVWTWFVAVHHNIGFINP
jgi:hypothetical protein